MDRAERRSRKEKAKDHAVRIVRHVWCSTQQAMEQWALENADNLKVCDKDCCKNIRRSGKGRDRFTRQELRSSEDLE